LAATWRLAPGWQLTARLDNATDEARVPARDYQGLGRQAWLVLRWSLGAGAAQ
jgi:vitamin B12 transporter